MTRIFFLLTILISLTSCEGFIFVKGTIKSSKTNEFIEGARIELVDLPIEKVYDSTNENSIDKIILSDRYGKFSFRSQMIGMVKVPRYKIRVSKKGYKTVEIKFNYTSNKEIEKAKVDSLIVMIDEI